MDIHRFILPCFPRIFLVPGVLDKVVLAAQARRSCRPTINFFFEDNLGWNTEAGVS